MLRNNLKILSAKGTEIGEVTSGNISPHLKRGIGMGYVRPKWGKKGSTIYVNVRGKLKRAEVVGLPFMPHQYKK